MDEHWTLSNLTKEAAARIAALPPPKNGQVRAVPDIRTIRYYATLGLIDKPSMRGRLAIYGKRHLAQVVSIKRLQAAGRSLADIQAMWPTMDDVALSRMSGVVLPGSIAARASRSEFWKRPLEAITAGPAEDGEGEEDELPAAGTRLPTGMARPLVAHLDESGQLADAPPAPPLELRVQLAPGITLSLAVPDGVSLTPDDVRALRAAASPLVELASRQLGSNDGGDDR